MGKVKSTKRVILGVLSITSSLSVWLISHWGAAVMALPPPDDIPEEILRTEIIIDARSPIDGKPISAAEYAELQAQLQKVPPPELNTKLRQTVFLLRIRKTLLQLFPFLDL
ncbi:hypothetical protein IQ244_25520 [Nostoc sp. LEGE 06077]|uniref:hypothetical protein n=1 Tax=Nostoc sp. LEGE 06077 TaxID=915325 RepID=UPI0018802F12|nr:hypothetical protein [Nostoc sp. LEGE 06077]MBE9209791.1 hypothetical protein [Nostoc sp. LEGE 06077]